MSKTSYSVTLPDELEKLLLSEMSSTQKSAADVLRTALAQYFKFQTPEVQRGGKRPGAGRPRATHQPD